MRAACSGSSAALAGRARDAETARSVKLREAPIYAVCGTNAPWHLAMPVQSCGCPGAPKSDYGGSGVTARAQQLYLQPCKKDLSAAVNIRGLLTSCWDCADLRSSHETEKRERGRPFLVMFLRFERAES